MTETSEGLTTALVEYQPTAAALAELRHRFGGVAFDLTSAKGEKEARAARLELVRLRSSLEAKRKELKAPALDRSRMIDDEAKRLTSAILDLESPIDEQIRASEAAKEVERQRKAAVESDRVRRHQERIAEIRAAATNRAAADSATLSAAIVAVENLDVSEALYQEFAPFAASAKADTLAALRTLHEGATVREAEAQRLAAERAELQRQREQQAAEQARIDTARKAEEERLATARRRQAEEVERERVAARARQDEADRLADEAWADADRKAAAERAEADRVAAMARATEQARLDAERRTLEVAQQAQREQAEREAAETAAAATEAERIERERRATEEALAQRQRAEEAAKLSRLHAAAPRLRNALQRLLLACKDPEGGGGQEYQDAIAEAETALGALT